MQKRGWIQIVEASISMLILFGLVLGLFQQNIETPDFASQVYKIQHQILTEASDDYCIRNEVLANNTESLNKFIASRLCSLPYNFTTALCSPTEACLFPERVEKPKTDIYSNNMIIAANLTSYNPVKIAFFAWQGSTECGVPYTCVTPTGCTSHASSACFDNDVYWYDSCGNREDKKEECGANNCINGACVAVPQEICYDGVDNDGDGFVDCKDHTDCDNKVGANYGSYSCPVGGCKCLAQEKFILEYPEACNDGFDNDGDTCLDDDDKGCGGPCGP